MNHQQADPPGDCSLVAGIAGTRAGRCRPSGREISVTPSMRMSVSDSGDTARLPGKIGRSPRAKPHRWLACHVHGISLGRQPEEERLARCIPPQVGVHSHSARTGTDKCSSNGMDVILRDGVIEYRAIGGTLDFCKWISESLL